MGTGNSRTQRALMDSVSADLSVSLDPHLDRVPADTAPVLSSATLSGHPVSRLITAEPRVAYVHRVAVSVYVGREPGERSVFGSDRPRSAARRVP